MNWTYLEREEVGLALDLRAAGLDAGDLDRERDGLDAALREMVLLEAGATANPDEGRQVGHYWLRAPERAPDPEVRLAIDRAREGTEALAASLLGRFPTVVHAGIGGSALGPQLLLDALAPPECPRRFVFLDNTDPDGFRRATAGLDWRRTLVVLVSKSGGTAETRNAQVAIARAFAGAGLRFPRHAVAITVPGSALDREAEGDGWLARIPMWDWVGGRFSVTSAVGLLPLALAGLDGDAFLDGAAAMDEATRDPDLARNPAALLALAWRRKAGRDRALVVLPYRDRLQLLARYLQQLVMESLGKRADREGRVVEEGLTVYGNKGSTDQHAYVQQLREGPRDFLATFVEVLSDPHDVEVDETGGGVTMGDHLSGFLAGTRRALHDAGRPSLTITLDRLDEGRLGALLALFERTVGIYASLLDVNAYHQPGVEAGKRAAKDVLALQGRLLDALRDGREGTAAELAKDAGGDEVDAFHVLRRLAATGRARSEGRGLDRRFRPA